MQQPILLTSFVVTESTGNDNLNVPVHRQLGLDTCTWLQINELDDKGAIFNTIAFNIAAGGMILGRLQRY